MTRDEMTKKERVMAFFKNEPVDHVPVELWQHFHSPFDKGDKYIAAQMEYYQKTDLDMIKISCDGYFNFPNPILKEIQKAEELYKMQSIGEKNPWIREQIQRAEDIMRETKGEIFTLYTIFCPLSYLRLEVGWDKMMELIHENPDAVKYACNVIADDVNYLTRKILATGVNGIFYSVQNAEVTRFTYEEYREWVTPGDRKVLDYINSLSDLNVLHCCGWEPVKNRLEDWKDYPSGAVNWAVYTDDLSVTQARKYFNRPVWGGFSNHEDGVLRIGTKSQIQAETRKLIEEGGKCGYMLGPDCSLPGDIPLEHIRWVVEEARKL